jgi:aromatic-L-amino-acid decarboxylase
MRAATLAGIPMANVRSIPTDDQFRIRLDLLADAVAVDRRNGYRPFLLVASAGTTNTGAIDPLPALVDIARAEQLWLHVDAAYGGFFLLTDRGRSLLPGIEQADSITLDPHKGLFLPYGTGSLLVRQGHLLRQAHQFEADYLQDLDADALNFADYSPELTRSFRGLRVWLPLQLHGVEAFARCLDEKLDLIRYATERLRAIPHLEIVAEPELSVVAFRTRTGHDLDLLQRINATRKTFLSSTVLHGRPSLRIAVLSFRTHQVHVDRTLEAIASSL